MQALGYLLVGHGTRNPTGQGEFLQLAKMLQERCTVPVEPCFLEIAQPAIEEGLQHLAQRGVQGVLVVPLLLFTAGHAKHDVPDAVAKVATPLGIQVLGQTAALEDHACLLELSRRRAGLEAASNWRTGSPPYLLLACRGGSDPEAIAAAKRYAAQLASSLGAQGEAAFVAIARPSLAETIARLATSGIKEVIVLPHLLFAGEVLHVIQAAVQSASEEHTAVRWTLGEHLGPHPLVLEVLLSRIAEHKIA